MRGERTRDGTWYATLSHPNTIKRVLDHLERPSQLRPRPPYSVDGAKRGQDFRFDRYDTYDWYLALGPLAALGAVAAARACREASALLQGGRDVFLRQAHGRGRDGLRQLPVASPPRDNPGSAKPRAHRRHGIRRTRVWRRSLRPVSTWCATMASTRMPPGVSVGATRPLSSSATLPIRRQHRPPPPRPCASAGRTCYGAWSAELFPLDDNQGGRRCPLRSARTE